MDVVERHERSLAMLGLEPKLFEATLEVGVLRTPSPVLIRKAVGTFELLVADQDHRREAGLKPIPDALIGLSWIEGAGLHAVPDDHRGQGRITVVRPNW